MVLTKKHPVFENNSWVEKGGGVVQKAQQGLLTPQQSCMQTARTRPYWPRLFRCAPPCFPLPCHEVKGKRKGIDCRAQRMRDLF